MTTYSIYSAEESLPVSTVSTDDETTSVFILDSGEEFTDIVITSVSEGFSEKGVTKSTLSDNFVMFCSGANPIRITISGKFPVYANKDNRLDFMSFYNTELRGSKFNMGFYYDSTYMRVYVVGVSTGETTASEDMVDFSITGYAFNYYTV